MMNQNEIDKVHSLILLISEEVKRICEKHHIPYFLTAGSTLGAVRHGGFIPWDEDMDIGMLRPDYERFLSVCAHELGERFFLHTWDTDPDYPFPFAKVRLNGTSLAEAFSQDVGCHHGVFVDIFPFDSAPDDPRQSRMQGFQYFMLYRMLWIKKGYGTNLKSESKMQWLRYQLFRLLALPVPYGWIKARFQKVMERYNGVRTQRVVTAGSYTYEKEAIRREWVEKLEMVPFEGTELPTYQQRVAYLRHMYGENWRIPPSEEVQKQKHQILSIDLGRYETLFEREEG